MGYEVACLCMCASVWGKQRQKAGWDVWERICSSNTNCSQKKNQFHLSGEIHHIIFCSPFICISTVVLWSVCVQACICVCVRVCPRVFHWGSNSECDVAHNVADNAAQHGGYGLKGVRITPTLIISFPILCLLPSLLLLEWSNLTGSTFASESYNVPLGRGSLMEHTQLISRK